MLQITSPYIFGACSAVFVLYVFYMMVRRRRGERPGQIDREPEL